MNWNVPAAVLFGLKSKIFDHGSPGECQTSITFFAVESLYNGGTLSSSLGIF
jgi:hypothetical protein